MDFNLEPQRIYNMSNGLKAVQVPPRRLGLLNAVFIALRMSSLAEVDAM